MSDVRIRVVLVTYGDLQKAAGRTVGGRSVAAGPRGRPPSSVVSKKGFVREARGAEPFLLTMVLGRKTKLKKQIAAYIRGLASFLHETRQLWSRLTMLRVSDERETLPRLYGCIR